MHLAPWNLAKRKARIELSGMRAYLEFGPYCGLPAWLTGRHPLYLTEDGRLVDEDGEVLDRDTFVRFRAELGARILTNSRGKVAAALGFSDGGVAGKLPGFRPLLPVDTCIYQPSRVRKRLLKDD